MPDGRSRYQILAGDVPRPIRGVAARKRIQRELHGIALSTPVPVECRSWFYDLRRGRRQIYGSLLRFIDVSVMMGVTRETLLRIPEWLTWYINDATESRDGLRRDNEPKRAA